ncbi:Photosystem II manganese-stabilizing polypeptide [Cylindrospermopsis raciborskii CHAB3438]|jgi:photosystem II oxygen-evolving enhancer protein 1|uniref:photosystem II manganese-stabilizing polypeptide n=1 Tax=Cylindrospermopsis raciborskii TaxID=77022 RepID=UPI000E1E8C8F|nr:photosystem II manganese-stabilizing polypeptide [Cylindrospermopsis raciborskii]MCH4904520.1 Photosystem II manganese-stabilizing polypeptide [Cylindrospermopsis raciborskii CHAB3438]MEB3147128.1 photosystem II manganese-stabilizing polypeptide [Cylindrospermopsis raciborskii]TPX29854.1 Photosystem II manganese-stabilizing polypeptide [Cylindrospermopsis raciborskii GIHE 2018]UJL33018.1 photosystem II manganese-stabilizing polypeptide [Cylindrospermopsis raciborskii Cr2010]UJS05505.1 photo
MRYRALIIAFLALCLGLITACSDAPSSSSKDLLTYEEIRGTGLANKCPQLSEVSRGSINLESNQSYTISELCLEPTSYFVKEEPANKRQEAEFVPGRLLTRYTSTIDQVQGDLKINPDNSLTFVEKDGFDFQAITVKLPGGELVPFLFTIKDLVAQTQPNSTNINTSTDFEGKFKVPSYRGAAFLDPKGRGVVSGYDNAVALPAQSDADDLTRTNVKRTEILQGKISLQVSRVDNSTGEIAGTFESEQPSDTDLGAGEPKEVKIRGLFYGRVSTNS